MLVLAVWSLTVALVAACDTDNATPPPDPGTPAAATIAFLQGDRVRFADTDGRVWGNLPVSTPYFPAVWSADGQHFAWLDDNHLHVVAAATSVDKAIPCPCSGLDRLGDKFATVSADGAALLLFDQNGTSTRVPLRRPMPGAWVGAGGRDQVAIAEPIPEDRAAYRGQSALTAVDAQGQDRLMIEADSAVSLAGGRTSPDGSRIATIEAPSSGACATAESVFVLNNAGLNPKTEPLVPSDTLFTTALLGEARDVTGMTWAGSWIVVTFGPKTSCQHLYPGRFLTYHLNGAQWQFLRSGALQVGYGADGRTYAIELADDIDTSEKPDKQLHGRLTLNQRDREHLTVADTVSRMWLTPSEQTAGQPQPGPQPDTRITTDDHGKPLAAPVTDLVGRIATALKANDPTSLTALCANCDADTLTLIRTPAGRAELARSLGTHPALNAKSLTFPGLTESSCADVRATPGSCTSQQIHDIATLGLQPEIDLDHNEWKYTAPVKGSIRFAVDQNGTATWVGQSHSAQGFRQQVNAQGAEPFYFFTSADRNYICGIDKTQAACQGTTEPVPPRPASCGEGPGWGHGMFVDANSKVDFLCAGGLMFYPIGREPQDRDVLRPGRTISAAGFTCTATDAGIRCSHDTDGHGFQIALKANERF